MPLRVSLRCADGSGQRKLTRKGNYNQTPSWCPRKEVPLIAFTARDERMAYDVPLSVRREKRLKPGSQRRAVSCSLNCLPDH